MIFVVKSFDINKYLSFLPTYEAIGLDVEKSDEDEICGITQILEPVVERDAVEEWKKLCEVGNEVKYTVVDKVDLSKCKKCEVVVLDGLWDILIEEEEYYVVK